jgi:hypothetical protein
MGFAIWEYHIDKDIDNEYSFFPHSNYREDIVYRRMKNFHIFSVIQIGSGN